MCRLRAVKRVTTLAYLAVVIALLLGGCQSMYYGAMEKIGIEKRDILVDRVDNAREAQQEAKDQFESALEKFIAVTDYSGGDLEKQYKTLKSEYEDTISRAETVRDKIKSVEDVADALFDEWQAELKQYSSADLRRSSERQLKATKKSYSILITAMKSAEKKIDPVLAAFNDRVLYLKHNLNANAIASLKRQRKSVETDIQGLIKDMNKSIAEADKFIKSMSKN
jgi:Skp family chaperone for outer membrane proteins